MTPRILGRVSAAALLAASAAAIAAPASAGSFYLQEQSVRGIGRANSGEGADMGASSLWWNAASIARSGREVYIGAHGLIVDSDVDNTGSTLTYALPAPTPPFPAGSIFRGSAPVGGDQHIHEVVQSGVVPNFAVALPVGDRFTVGLAAQAPYNFTTEDAVGDVEQRDVESAAAQVEDQDRLLLVALVQAVGQRGGGRLVDDAVDRQARDLAGLLGGLTLGVAEVGRNRDDGVGDGLAQVGLGVRFELLQDQGADFLG